MLELGTRELGSVQDVSVALAVAVVDGQLLHGLQLAAELNILGRLLKVTAMFICGLYNEALFTKLEQAIMMQTKYLKPN